MDTKTEQTRRDLTWAEVEKYLADKDVLSSIYGMFADMESSYPRDQVREMTQYSDTDSIRIGKE